MLTRTLIERNLEHRWESFFLFAPLDASVMYIALKRRCRGHDRTLMEWMTTDGMDDHWYMQPDTEGARIPRHQH